MTSVGFLWFALAQLELFYSSLIWAFQADSSLCLLAKLAQVLTFH